MSAWGAGKSPFYIIKLRSMLFNDHGDPELRAKNRVTPLGRFLRKTRIDELPQLVNVLTGDLSFIGPRPELPSLAAVYEEEVPYYDARHLVTPGLSGWAQIYDYDARAAAQTWSAPSASSPTTFTTSSIAPSASTWPSPSRRSARSLAFGDIGKALLSVKNQVDRKDYERTRNRRRRSDRLHMAETLLRAGCGVRGVDSFSPYYDLALKRMTVAEIQAAGVQFVEADLCIADLAPLLEGIDVIYHFAAQPGIARISRSGSTWKITCTRRSGFWKRRTRKGTSRSSYRSPPLPCTARMHHPMRRQRRSRRRTTA